MYRIKPESPIMAIFISTSAVASEELVALALVSLIPMIIQFKTRLTVQILYGVFINVLFSRDYT